MKLATGDEGLPDDPVERRRIVLRRVQFALKAAVKQNRLLDITKLALRAGEEVAGNTRQTNLFIDNSDLIVALCGPERAQEVVFRHQAGKWLGTGFADAAAILVGDPKFHGEARNMLRCAEEWLRHWAGLSPEERKKQSISNEDIAAMAFAHLRLHGPKALIDDLSHWTPVTINFTVGRSIISRLVDANEFDLINEIAEAANKSPYLVLAITEELAKVGKTWGTYW